MAAGLATAALAVVLRIRTGRVRAGEQRERAHAAERERVECAVELVYADWLDLEATRGLDELEQWRRSSSG